MKKFTFLVVAALLSVAGSAQLTVNQQLDNAVFAAENIQQNAQTARAVSDNLALQILVNAPDANQFYNNIVPALNGTLDEADNAIYWANEARIQSGNAFGIDGVVDLAVEVQNQQSIALDLSNQIKTAVENGNNTSALNLIASLNIVLNFQQSLANDIISVVEEIRANYTPVYNVCIRIVNNQGVEVPANDLYGYYAYNNSTGEYIFLDERSGACFEALPAGTYTFDAFDGYFSGTVEVTVTLSQSLVNAQGIIVVDLVYWSE
ncbi:MAG: hypothetical protein ACRC3B_19405 [Bacteroidia bacterium]